MGQSEQDFSNAVSDFALISMSRAELESEVLGLRAKLARQWQAPVAQDGQQSAATLRCARCGHDTMVLPCGPQATDHPTTGDRNAE